MGQRHQLFIQAPLSVYKDDKGKGMTAWHNQWLYGTLPLATLKRLLQYEKEASDYKWESLPPNERNPMVKFKTILQSIMEFDYTNQSFSKYHDEGEYLINDYRAGDNNDGLTFLVLSDTGKPKYAFMTGPETGGNSMEAGHCLSATQYMEAYYPPDTKRLELRKTGLKLAEYIEENADLLTDEEVKLLFPKM